MFKTIKKLSIETQVFYLMSISLVLVLIFSAGKTYDLHKSLSQERNVKYLTEYIPFVSELIHELQRERGLSAGYLSSDDLNPMQSDLATQYERTNVALEAFQSRVKNGELRFNNDDLGEKVRLATASLLKISNVREGIRKKESTLNAGTQNYTNFVSQLLEFINLLPNHATSPALNKEIKAYLSILEIKENSGLERAMGAAGFAAGFFNADVYNDFYLRVKSQEKLLDVYMANASPENKILYKTMSDRPEMGKLKEIEGHVFLTLGNVDLNVIAVEDWFGLITQKVDQLHKIENKLSKSLLAHASGLAQKSYRKFWILSIILVALVGGGALLSIVLIEAIFFNHNSMQQDASDQEERYAQLIQTGPFGVCETDSKGNIKVVNPSFVTMFGDHDDVDFIGMNFMDLISPQKRPEAKSSFAKALKRETVFFEFEKEETENYFSSFVFPIRSEGAAVTDMMILIEDKTLMRKHEKDISVAVANSDSAQKAKTKFIANMNHELRTPLNHILGFTQLLQSKPRSVQDKEMLDYVLSGGEELLEKVNSIVDLSNQDEAHISTFGLTEIPLFAAALKEFGAKVKSAGKEFMMVGFKGCIPVRCDPGDLLLAINHIFDNALKFTAPKDFITIRFNVESNFVVIKIIDTGPGIPKEHLEDVTIPFVTVNDSYSRPVGGMGIGLAATKQLMARNNGFLDIKSVEGKGTCVSLKVPRAITSDLSISLNADLAETDLKVS